MVRSLNRVEREHCLVSPNDIGLGNYLRTYGDGKPESSFFFLPRTHQSIGENERAYLKSLKARLYPFRHLILRPYVTHRTRSASK